MNADVAHKTCLRCLKTVSLIFGRRGIAPTRNCNHLFKNVLNLFLSIKINFFLKIFLSLVDIIGIKPAPGDHESNFKKVMQLRVGAIPSEP